MPLAGIGIILLHSRLTTGLCAGSNCSYLPVPGFFVAAWKSFLLHKGVVVINGDLGDVSRVSTEVTEEVIVTAVEAGASARRVIQFFVIALTIAAVVFVV